jgi:hypothetical protein
MRTKVCLALALGVAVGSGASRAQLPEITAPPATGTEPPRTEQPPARSQPGGPPRVACWAVPSDTGSYVGYYVGGGSACRGGPRAVAEGTWGWDYHGCLIPQRVALLWNRRRRQGGVGAYKVDGPHLLHPSKHGRNDP